MKQSSEETWTKAEILQMLLAPRPKPAPKPATVKAEERWSGDKPLSAVLQDAQRADAAATEKLRREREREDAESDRRAAEYKRACYQAEIDEAWQRCADYRRELEEWRDW